MRGDSEAAGDRAVRSSLGQQAQNFSFARRQPARPECRREKPGQARQNHDRVRPFARLHEPHPRQDRRARRRGDPRGPDRRRPGQGEPARSPHGSRRRPLADRDAHLGELASPGAILPTPSVRRPGGPSRRTSAGTLRSVSPLSGHQASPWCSPAAEPGPCGPTLITMTPAPPPSSSATCWRPRPTYPRATRPCPSRLAATRSMVGAGIERQRPAAAAPTPPSRGIGRRRRGRARLRRFAASRCRVRCGRRSHPRAGCAKVRRPGTPSPRAAIKDAPPRRRRRARRRRPPRPPAREGGRGEIRPGSRAAVRCRSTDRDRGLGTGACRRPGA